MLSRNRPAVSYNVLIHYFFKQLHKQLHSLCLFYPRISRCASQDVTTRGRSISLRAGWPEDGAAEAFDWGAEAAQLQPHSLHRTAQDVQNGGNYVNNIKAGFGYFKESDGHVYSGFWAHDNFIGDKNKQKKNNE